MHGAASKLGEKLIHIKSIILAKEKKFLLFRHVALYLGMKEQAHNCCNMNSGQMSKCTLCSSTYQY